MVGLTRAINAGSTFCGAQGSRAGAVLRRRGLSVSPRFLWECRTVLVQREDDSEVGR